MSQVVVFVCPHGALKSRLAAAFFNAAAGPGWRAASAGLEPQADPSVHAAALVAGTAAAALLESGPPRGLSTVDSRDRVVAIDCEVPGALSWQLADQSPSEPMRDEIRSRATAFAREVIDD